MKAVILAAGIASRLRPLTNHTPKCLLQVAGKSLLERTIDAVVSNGVSDIVIVTGYLREMLEDFVARTYPELNVMFIYNKDYASTNNIYSLWLTKEAVKNDSLLLLDSDILFDSRIIARLLESGYDSCLALNSHKLGEEEIKVIASPANKVMEISKTCAITDALGESVGIEKMSPAFVNALFAEMDSMILEQGLSNVFYELAFERIIRQGATLYVVDTTSLFSMELDTVEDFEQVQKLLPANLY
ncbi:MAG: phosphocholine cytidylyltransferase family protein [Prevotella sp.]|jgi:choline kinase|nr:phosphocholine cytidylyltransferase family protein [Prevotella sp.]